MLIFTNTRNSCPEPVRRARRELCSLRMVRTRCSSMPSAETLVKPAGSTRVTLAVKRRAAPALDGRCGALDDLHRVGRQQLHHQLEIVWIADLDQRRSRQRPPVRFPG